MHIIVIAKDYDWQAHIAKLNFHIKCHSKVINCKGSFGGRQGQPSARPWHLLIRSLGLAALPPPSVRLLSTEAIAYLITISSSSIDSLCDSCSACLLPTVHPGNTPYIRTDPTLSGGSRLAAGSSIFTILHFLPRMIAYAAEQLHQQMPGRSHPLITVDWNTDQVLDLT